MAICQKTKGQKEMRGLQGRSSGPRSYNIELLFLDRYAPLSQLKTKALPAVGFQERIYGLSSNVAPARSSCLEA